MQLLLLVMANVVGPSDAHLATGTFESFVKVPNLLRPHTQIFCTRYTFLSFGTCKTLCSGNIQITAYELFQGFF